MSSRYSSPPWSAGGSPYPNSALYAMAPAMPYVPLPPCHDHYHPPPPPPLHHGLMTPPPSPARVHPVLGATPTVLRYDLARDPSTLRMSSAARDPSFPGDDPASAPSAAVLNVRCERSGALIAVHTRGGAVSCWDVVAQLHAYFQQEVSVEEWQGVRGARRDAMKAAYERRTGRPYASSARMRRVDYLCGKSTFRRIVLERADASASTWVLQTS